MNFRLFHNMGFTTLGLLLIVACSSTANTSNTSGAGGANSVVPGGGTGGQGTGGTIIGASGSAGASGSTGGLSAGGTVGTSGAGGVVGTGGTAGTGGTIVAGSGGEATGGSGGDASGGAAGAAGTGGTGGLGGGVRTGMSVGCGTNPRANDSSDNPVKYDVDIAGLDPVYLQGGEFYDSSGSYNFSHRPYSVRLPQGYDPNTPYKVTFGGGGCGAEAGNWDGGLGLQIAGNGNTLQVGLMYITTCFEDGGPAVGNRTDTPDEPYFRAVMADLEAHYCIDLSQVFVSGFSSGAWEAYTLGCAASDLIRGISAAEGGMRDMHPVCKGPVAAVLVAGELDGENPIGPLDDNNADDLNDINRLGSHGSAPGRDDILARNGCVGTATAPYSDPTYSACVQYTGCPEAYPVIWCALPGQGHGSTSYNGENYSPGPMWDVLGSLPAP